MQEPVMSAFAIAIMASPIAKSIAIGYATKKKLVRDLKESTRFGQFDKVWLQALFRDTLATLRLPDENLSLYILASPSMNAYARHEGLGMFFKSLNGVYLNRQTLHKLEPAEVQDLHPPEPFAEQHVVYYLRAHGRNWKKWCTMSTSDERCDYLYTPDEIHAFGETLKVFWTCRTLSPWRIRSRKSLNRSRASASRSPRISNR